MSHIEKCTENMLWEKTHMNFITKLILLQMKEIIDCSLLLDKSKSTQQAPNQVTLPQQKQLRGRNLVVPTILPNQVHVPSQVKWYYYHIFMDFVELKNGGQEIANDHIFTEEEKALICPMTSINGSTWWHMEWRIQYARRQPNLFKILNLVVSQESNLLFHGHQWSLEWYSSSWEPNLLKDTQLIDCCYLQERSKRHQQCSTIWQTLHWLMMRWNKL